MSSKTNLLLQPEYAFKQLHENKLFYEMLEDLSHPLLQKLDTMYSNLETIFHLQKKSYKKISVPITFGDKKIVLDLTLKNCLTLTDFKEDFVKVLFELAIAKVFTPFYGKPLKEFHQFLLNGDTWNDLLYFLSDCSLTK